MTCSPKSSPVLILDLSPEINNKMKCAEVDPKFSGILEIQVSSSGRYWTVPELLFEKIFDSSTAATAYPNSLLRIKYRRLLWFLCLALDIPSCINLLFLFCNSITHFHKIFPIHSLYVVPMFTMVGFTLNPTLSNIHLPVRHKFFRNRLKIVLYK